MYKYGMLLTVWIIISCYSWASNEDYYHIYNVYITGNKITRDKVILQEANLHAEDSIAKKDIQDILKKSRNRIYNLGLFNEVTVSFQEKNPPYILVDIVVTERWYIWPVPVFELRDRNLNIWWQHKSLKRVSYGITGGIENFRGRNESIALSLTTGYSKAAILVYDIPNVNYTYRIGLNMMGIYSQRKELVYATTKGKEQFYKQHLTPSRTYQTFRIASTKRITLLRKLEAYAQYRAIQISDSVLVFNPEYLLSKHTSINYGKVGLKYWDNHVDIVEYPLKGYTYSVETQWAGLGSQRFNTFKAFFNYQLYGKIAGKRHFWKYEGNSAWLSQKALPFEEYLFMGYDDVVRGNEYYVQQGHAKALQSLEYRYVLIPRKIYPMRWMFIRQFRNLPWAAYFTAFTDAGYMYNRQHIANPLVNRTIYGYGLGLNILAPYGTVIKIDHSWNQFNENNWYVTAKVNF